MQLRLALLCLIVAAPCCGQIIVNGSFESPALGSTQNYTGAFSFTGWSGVAQSSGGNAGLVVGTDFGLTPRAGSQHFSFNGDNPPAGGYIEQTFSTITGASYQLTFSLGRNGNTGQGLQATVEVFDGSTLITSANRSPDQVIGYTDFSLTFAALSTSTRLRFTDSSQSNTISDLFVDNVAVTAIPEPGAYAVISGAIAGLLVILRRRKPSCHRFDSTAEIHPE